MKVRRKKFGGRTLRPRLRRRRRTTVTLTAVLLLLIPLAAVVFVYRFRYDVERNLERATLPEAVEYGAPTPARALPSAQSTPTTTAPTATARPTAAPQASTLPAEINLAVPFTSQAPHANWSLPYKEFCEEASTLMAIRYVTKQPIASAEDADAAMLAIKQFEEAVIGEYLDTNAADTAKILTQHFKYNNVQLLENPTALTIKTALAQGKPVIAPMAGRELGNPHFQTPGPLYHMIVIKGYTKDGDFIVNDPGTRHGADFLYSEATILNALHDWRDDEQIQLGRKVVIVVG